ncbi:sigma-70 family RNA polymerase sigma factor [Vibrio sp. HN007]|uniref:sigma-70 family RNA polymerase sigma factor n=1 Tax=Vibrio iocasae TaxID=3098914 RepID=UPI0035D44BDA
MKQTDEELMIAYSKGDGSAFAELYQRHKASLFRYFVRQLPDNRARAEELFQDAWFRVVDKRQTYTEKAKFTTWLYSISHNLVVDEYRKSSVRKPELVVVGDDELSVSTDDPEQRKVSALKNCIELLPEQQRESFLLKHEAGFETSQIGEITGQKKETIKTRLRYALDQLRHCLTKKLGERT